MTPFQSIILGLVQGATEFIPISSTAHLILFPWLAEWPAPGQTFDVALHAGTLLALLIYFARDWIAMIASIFRRPDPLNPDPARRSLILVIIGCIPAAVVAVLFEDYLEKFADPGKMQTAPLFIAAFLIVGAILLSFAERVSRRMHRLETRNPLDAFVIGMFQTLSLLPGFSRSGSSIAGGLFVGLTREDAAKFSFLMSAPLIGGAVAWKVKDLVQMGIPREEWVTLLCGVAAAAVAGYICIAFLLAYLRRRSNALFIYYRYVLGAFIVIQYYLR